MTTRLYIPIRLAPLLLAVVLGGCKPRQTGRYEVAGTVTYAGSPVPRGEIVFEPDPARGNSGPQGRARIEDGKFKTVQGRGSVAGPVTARLLPYDGNIQAEMPLGAPLRPAYEISLDLPAAPSTHDFDIPAP